jgi:hypothetical protein
MLRPSVVRLIALAGLLLAPVLAAQDPPAAPDTLPRDTVRVDIPPEAVAADTLPEATRPGEVHDSLRAGPELPRYPRLGGTGWSAGVWEWHTAELERMHGLSLADIVRRVPGLALVRAGAVGQPLGTTTAGLGGGRLRLFLDGVEMDPVDAATLDLHRLSLADLARVRVERGPLGIRIDVETLAPPDRRPYTRLEIGTGDFQTRLLRVAFGRPLFERHAVFVGFDVFDTRGPLVRERYDHSAGIARWTFQPTEATGFQLEYRTHAFTRPDEPFVETGARRDLIFRARARPARTLEGDFSLVRTTWDAVPGMEHLGGPDEWQGAARGRLRTAFGWAEGELRGRSRTGGIPAGGGRASARAGLHLGGFVEAEGGIAAERAGGEGGAEIDGRFTVTPLPGISLFASGASGSRPAGLVRDSVFVLVSHLPQVVDGRLVIQREERDTTVFATGRVPLTGSAARAGAELALGPAQLGGAWLWNDVDLVVPFGLSFDRGIEPVSVSPASGVEGTLRTRLLAEPLTLEASYLRWLETGARPYLPVEEAIVALEFHRTYYTGNLEPTLRLEARHRGSMRVPGAEAMGYDQVTEPYLFTRGELQIRVIDVQLFFLWDNLLARRDVADIPGRPFPPVPHGAFGVRWTFFN